ncbi:uncharacterized protein EDB93DRAFT_1157175 [Suillus bovinus]|uniref:uncharacterized protein n=1 Tax=Suillus bovinus TaxID=48563 RepID=UPI001B86B283|nr:uncharacterized protein EDB93DRAFT_1157175 [Suillus bovinus]KAG2142915.1 hypothetical protein EDB93DRAFT_1157175 [Suillus bovinus]
MLSSKFVVTAILSASRVVFSTQSTKAMNRRSPMLQIVVLRFKFCHNVDDFTDAAKVAAPPALLTIKMLASSR